MAQYTKDGRLEVPDPTPIELPVGYEAPEPLESMIARLVRHESERAQAEGAESFEEADDFETDEDETVLVSPYEMQDMKEERLDVREKRTKHSKQADDSGSHDSDNTEKAEEKQEVKSTPKAKKVPKPDVKNEEA